MTIALPLVESPGSAPPLVSFRDLRVNRGRVEVLRGLTADVQRGTVTALVGLNGCGKSTLLRTLLHEFPYRGTIAFHCGHDHRQPRPDHVGYVPQRLTVDPRLPLTVRDLMGLTLKRGPLFLGLGRKLNARIARLLEQVDVGHLIDTPLEGVSGGQLQRILLALALEPSPELLLLDEPAAGIDFQSQQAFYDLIRRINRTTDVTILLVSHDLNLIARIADHVLCLSGGVVAAQGPPATVLTPDSLAKTFGPGLRELVQPPPPAEPHEHTAACGHG